ncbi:MAG: Crp/Fnr family transcriptional regulator [Halothiobacillus sp.]
MTIEGSALQNTIIGRELTTEQCQVLASICAQQTIANGQMLFAEGACSNTLFIVTSGRFAVSRNTGRGFSDTVHLLATGELAGESGFLDGAPHSATLRAVGDAQVLTIERARLEALLIDHPIIVYKVMRAIVYSIREITRRMNQQHQQMLNYINPDCGRF